MIPGLYAAAGHVEHLVRYLDFRAETQEDEEQYPTEHHHEWIPVRVVFFVFDADEEQEECDDVEQDEDDFKHEAWLLGNLRVSH